MPTPLLVARPVPDLQSRDPFSGDCDFLVVPLRVMTCYVTCRAETRSQGIATQPAAPPRQRGGSSRLQSRDPFSGDCDHSLYPLAGRAPVDNACRAETRSQGIATQRVLGETATGVIVHLQSRDPFSGDCDVGATRRVAPTFLALRRLRE